MNMNDLSGSAAKLILLIASLVLSPVIWVNAFDLTVHSWHWLIWGYLGQLTLMSIGGAWSKSK
jgi:hypothetical protein